VDRLDRRDAPPRHVLDCGFHRGNHGRHDRFQGVSRGPVLRTKSSSHTTDRIFSIRNSHLNSSTPFSLDEYEAVWKLPPYAPWGLDKYPDFQFDNSHYNESCIMPEFWLDNGVRLDPAPAVGCFESEFDQYGDTEAFGVFPDWQRQLSKFASVQDRLREWMPSVNDKLSKLSCLAIQALDIDGIRIDKATQVTVLALAQWSQHVRECAVAVNKTNFFIPGEVTGGDTFGALYYGRGRMPTQLPDFGEAQTITRNDDQFFLREAGVNSLDSSAFHYSIYRSLARFLGMDGNLQTAYDIPVNFVDAWSYMVRTNDFINYNTDIFDPRHQYGTTNQDVFRWPSLTNGTHKNALGNFITALVLPGQPLLWYGEEQAMYLFDNGASNYLYGRQAMTSTKAWQRHGCYKMGSSQYYNMPYDKALTGCDDDWNALDHFDPTAEPRRLIAHMNELRSLFPVLQDGLDLHAMNNVTRYIQLPGSNMTQTELGLWIVERGPLAFQANDTAVFGGTTDYGNKVLLLYTNENQTINYQANCLADGWMKTSFAAPVTLRNLFYPYERYPLQDSTEGFFGGTETPFRGCLPNVTMAPYEFKALVPEARWTLGAPAMTRFTPGHDARVLSDDSNTIRIRIEYDQEMDCASVQAGITISGSFGGSSMTPTLSSTANCQTFTPPADELPDIVGVAPSAWYIEATIENAPDGVYNIQVGRVNAQAGGRPTTATDHIIVRKGTAENAMVFTDAADYSDTILTESDGVYTINHASPGADKFRYSADFGQTWIDWTDYETTTTANATLFEDKWWDGHHVEVQYWSEIAGTASVMVHGDAGWKGRRRFPQLLLRGEFNEWGFDSGREAALKNDEQGVWSMPFMSTWPAYVQLNVYGFDDYFYGDTDSDGIIDRLPPNALSPNYLNISTPPMPHVSWTLYVDDKTGEWYIIPRGHFVAAVVLFALLLAIPPITAFAAAAIFRYSFYAIKINKWGVKPTKGTSYFQLGREKKSDAGADMVGGAVVLSEKKEKHPVKPIGWPEVPGKRRKVLIATLEYEIIDWKLKVKIGGLGVMSSLMGKAMSDCDMIWVVPKVKDIEYPQGDYAEPIEVIIFGEPYLIEVETHQLDNITYVILDSPVFRAQTKADPYPQRMDDLSSAIFYSTWNQAIAETIRRNPVIDIYHINDYHGALAPLYLLPKILPTCLSLHNAEFQGLWPLRTKEEMKEVCAAFNIPKEVCTKYVQFGNTFNLLHAGASFISLHQKSIGVAGVSDKYGKRSWARYPALWTLKNIDSLPNPDPTDIAALDSQPIAVDKIEVDQGAESKRPEDKRLAQEWAGLKQDPNAELFVFVGRWSKQKGVDLIADVMPSILDKKPKVQLITVGPVIDLYGRFAAEKLARLMELYPDRVFSKPEFTALPPYLFSGADFALIPSRDEPFGLVAVEFGRKGALGVGARLGGLGLMPGWWFPVESSATEHMLSQLTKTIKLALRSTQEERAILRARSAVQRFPVVEWRQRLEDFQKRSIAVSRQLAGENAYYYDMDLTGPGGLYQHQNDSMASLAGGDWRNSIQSIPDSPNPGGHRGSITPSPLASPSMSPTPQHGFEDQRGGYPQNNGYLSAENPNRKANRASADSFYEDDPDRRSAQGAHVPPLYYDRDQSPSADVNPANPAGPKFFTGNAYSPNGGDIYEDDEQSERGSTAANSYTQNGSTNGQPYDSFLAAANRQIAKQTKGTRDPFMERRQSMDSQAGIGSPTRPFTAHSRQSSFDSISSIMDEKGASSPLNKAIVDFTDSDGEVAQTFVQRLQILSADNSKTDLCIEKFLMKSEKEFFDVVKKGKMSCELIWYTVS
jgi:alpha-1,3-glucan synthase